MPLLARFTSLSLSWNEDDKCLPHLSAVDSFMDLHTITNAGNGVSVNLFKKPLVYVAGIFMIFFFVMIMVILHDSDTLNATLTYENPVNLPRGLE